MDVEEFKKSCSSFSPGEVVERYLIEQPSYFFEHIQKGKEYEFKKDIARVLNVHIRDIVIVGSGKLGFSMKPDPIDLRMYHYIAFDGKPNAKSDLDIAIVSSSLFDREMQNLYDDIVYTKINWSERNSFAKYMLKGRLAIRYLPKEFKFTKEVRNVIDKYGLEYGREVNLEIYKSWHYFETYHEDNVHNIKLNLIAGM